jgi:hypothetical protein
VGSSNRVTLVDALSSKIFSSDRSFALGGILMSGQVILYFEDQSDALRFALAAGSVMAGDGASVTDDLIHETTRVSRIRLDAVNAGNARKPASERVA